MLKRVAGGLFVTLVACFCAPAALAVGATPQTIAFASTPPSSPMPALSSYTPSASATSGLTVEFTIDLASTSSCSYNTGTGAVTFFTPGVCIIDADQPGDATYAAAPQVQQSVNVAKLPNAITFVSTPAQQPATVGTAYQPVALATSGEQVQFSIDAVSGNACTLLQFPSANTVRFDNPGTCVIDADAPGNPTFAAAPRKQQAVVVVGTSLSIQFTSQPNQPAYVGTSYAPQANAIPVPLPVTFSIDATSTGCSLTFIPQAVVHFDSEGLCVIDADVPASPQFAAAPRVQQKIVVSRLPNTIQVQPVPFSPAIAGVTGFNPFASATSGNLVKVTVDGSSSGCVYTPGSNLVTFNAIGTCVLDFNDPGTTIFAAAAQVQLTIPIVGQSQTVSFTTLFAPQPAHPGDQYAAAATSSSFLPVVIGLDATSTGCSISGSLVTFIGAGTCVIDATQPGNAVFAPALAQQTVHVVGNSNTIAFTSTPSTLPAPVGSTYTPTATASSGLPVVFSIDATSTGCTLTAGVVTFNSSGICVIDANEPGNALYGPAAQVQQPVPIAKTAQTITFTTTPPSPVAAGSSYPVAATATSGLTVTLTLDGASSGCALNGHLVILGGPGVCLIDANQSGDSVYLAAPQVQLAIVIKASQMIIFGAPPVTPAVGTTYTPHPIATSGLPVALSLDGTSTGCTLTAGVVTFTAIGTCVINGDQAGNSQFAAAPQASQSIVVLPGAQTITFTSSPPVPAGVGGTYNVAATATSGLTVAFTLDGTSTGCSLLGSQVTFTAFGTCVIDANQAGTSSWSAAPQMQQTIAISQGSQTITFTSTPPNPGLIGGQYNVAATASSGLPVLLTLDPGSLGCGLVGSVVSFFSPGTCVIDANQPGNASFAPALQAQQSFPVRVPQTITFTSTMPASPVLGTTYAPTAIASSGLAVVFSIDGTSVGCSLVSGVVHFNKKGTCVLDANQAGNGIYAPAPQVQQSTGSKKPQTITFTSTPPNPGKVGTTYRVSATATSKLVVKLTLDGASTGCTLSGAVVTFTAPGTCRIDADQAGNANWTAATQAQQTIAVKRSQTISFSTAPPRASVGGTYTPAATATSGLTVVLTLAASSRGCSLAAGVVSFVARGTCVIAANQPGNGNFAAAPQVVQSFVIKR